MKAAFRHKTDLALSIDFWVESIKRKQQKSIALKYPHTNRKETSLNFKTSIYETFFYKDM